MNTYIQPGHVIDITASGSDIKSGDVVVVGSIIAVAMTDIPDGETGSGSVEGVHSLPKVDATAISQGAKVYWDGSKFVTTASGNTLGGYAFVSADAADATVAVKINAAT